MLNSLYDRAIRDTIQRFEATGSPVIIDGEVQMVLQYEVTVTIWHKIAARVRTPRPAWRIAGGGGGIRTHKGHAAQRFSSPFGGEHLLLGGLLTRQNRQNH